MLSLSNFDHAFQSLTVGFDALRHHIGDLDVQLPFETSRDRLDIFDRMKRDASKKTTSRRHCRVNPAGRNESRHLTVRHSNNEMIEFQAIEIRGSVNSSCALNRE